MPLIRVKKHHDLVYDVGMYQGKDTDFYLRKGFRVVGFEADPDWARHCRERFEDSVAAGRLTIVEGAIVEGEAGEVPETVAFYKNEHTSAWGTVDAEWAERAARMGRPGRRIEVDAVDFAAAIEEHGMPYYMKIDVEGVDLACIEALRKFSVRPDYVSFESDKTSLEKIRREIEILLELGYDAFQAVEQSSIPDVQEPPFPPREGEYVPQGFELGSSGLFGAELGPEWKSQAEVLRQYRLVRLGYFLVGDDGVIRRLRLRFLKPFGRLRRALRWKLRTMTSALVRRFTKAPVPGWYDTHARHSSAVVGRRHALEPETGRRAGSTVQASEVRRRPAEEAAVAGVASHDGHLGAAGRPGAGGSRRERLRDAEPDDLPAAAGPPEEDVRG